MRRQDTILAFHGADKSHHAGLVSAEGVDRAAEGLANDRLNPRIARQKNAVVAEERDGSVLPEHDRPKLLFELLNVDRGEKQTRKLAVDCSYGTSKWYNPCAGRSFADRFADEGSPGFVRLEDLKE